MSPWPGCLERAHTTQRDGRRAERPRDSQKPPNCPFKAHRPMRCCLEQLLVRSSLSTLSQLDNANSSLGCWPGSPSCLDTASSEEVFRASSLVGKNADWGCVERKEGKG